MVSVIVVEPQNSNIYPLTTDDEFFMKDIVLNHYVARKLNDRFIIITSYEDISKEINQIENRFLILKFDNAPVNDNDLLLIENLLNSKGFSPCQK